MCEEMDSECNACGKTLSHEVFRGLVSRPIETVAVIEAVGVCDACSLSSKPAAPHGLRVFLFERTHNKGESDKPECLGSCLSRRKLCKIFN